MTRDSTAWQARAKDWARQANRLRWVRKYRIVAEHSGNATWPEAVRYVLTDPELDTFSYELANAPDLATEIAPLLDATPEKVLAWFEEACTDDVLRRRIRTAASGDLSVKRQPPIGRHLISYAIMRATTPELTLEIGVRHGLGSLVLLRALERNASEGRPGNLVSVDSDPYAGHMVTPGTPRWQFVRGSSPDCLAAALGDRQVGFLISDSVPTRSVTIGEITAGLNHAATPLMVLQSGWNIVLPEVCVAVGIPCLELNEQPVSHVGSGRRSYLARFSDATAVAVASDSVRRVGPEEPARSDAGVQPPTV